MTGNDTYQDPPRPALRPDPHRPRPGIYRHPPRTAAAFPSSSSSLRGPPLSLARSRRARRLCRRARSIVRAPGVSYTRSDHPSYASPSSLPSRRVVVSTTRELGGGGGYDTHWILETRQRAIGHIAPGTCVSRVILATSVRQLDLPRSSHSTHARRRVLSLLRPRDGER